MGTLNLKSNSVGVLPSLHLASNFSLLVWLTGHGKTVAAWINTWKQLPLSSVIPSKKHKRTWMRRAPVLFAEKPAACQESLAADCFPGGRTSRRTMTFLCPQKKKGGGSKNWRGWQQELMRCSRWANEPLKETKTGWSYDLEYCCMTWNICKGCNDYYTTIFVGVTWCN